jgi:hypothetical protein
MAGEGGGRGMAADGEEEAGGGGGGGGGRGGWRSWVKMGERRKSTRVWG